MKERRVVIIRVEETMMEDLLQGGREERMKRRERSWFSRRL